METGDVLVFKVYSDFSIKKLFKDTRREGERPFEFMNRIRNRLIHRRQNVGTIYVVMQERHGITLEKFRNGIPQDGYDEDTAYLFYEHLEYVIRVTNRNKPRKADWIKVRK